MAAAKLENLQAAMPNLRSRCSDLQQATELKAAAARERQCGHRALQCQMPSVQPEQFGEKQKVEERWNYALSRLAESSKYEVLT